MTELTVDNSLIRGRKIFYLEGIRGLAAFLVCIHHFLLAYYPALFTGNVLQTHTNSLEINFYHSPFIFLINGRLFVYIFFILSGFVLSKKTFFQPDIKYLNSAFARRYPRLYIPVFVALVIAYLCIRLHLNHNIEVGKVTKSLWLETHHGDPSLVRFLASLIYKAMFFRDDHYLTVLWTISIEFYGSLLVFGTMALTGMLRNSYFFLIVIFLIFLVSLKFEYCAFVLGMVLNYFATYQITNGFYKRLLVMVLIVGGLFLGGFPNIYITATPSLNGTIYEFLNYAKIIKYGGLLNCIGAFCLISAVFQSNLLQRFFSHRVLSFLGNISFSLYLIHIIILLSFSTILFQFLSASLDYNLSALIVLGLSFILLIALSFVMTIYVDKKSLSISSKLYNKYFA